MLLESTRHFGGRTRKSRLGCCRRQVQLTVLKAFPTGISISRSRIDAAILLKSVTPEFPIPYSVLLFQYKMEKSLPRLWQSKHSNAIVISTNNIDKQNEKIMAYNRPSCNTSLSTDKMNLFFFFIRILNQERGAVSALLQNYDCCNMY